MATTEEPKEVAENVTIKKKKTRSSKNVTIKKKKTRSSKEICAVPSPKTATSEQQCQDKEKQRRTRRTNCWGTRIFKTTMALALLALHEFQLNNKTINSRLVYDAPPTHQHPPVLRLPLTIPAAFVSTEELYTSKQNKNTTTTTTTTTNVTTTTAMVAMNPTVYERLTTKIHQLKETNKLLLIKVNSHPCAGKSFFITQNKSNFMGCNLRDHDALGRDYTGPKDSSFLIWQALINQPTSHHSAMLGSANVGGKRDKEYDDVVTIYVIPPLTTVERNVMERKKKLNGKGTQWSRLDTVIKKRRESLNYAIQNEVLVKPLFATFREGLEFCINAYGKTDVHDHYEAVLIAKEKTKKKK